MLVDMESPSSTIPQWELRLRELGSPQGALRTKPSKPNVNLIRGNVEAAQNGQASAAKEKEAHKGL